MSSTPVPTDAHAPHVSFVIPVYNERATIEEILWRVQAVDVDKELIVVDDGSTDGTREVLREVAESSARTPSRTRTLSSPRTTLIVTYAPLTPADGGIPSRHAAPRRVRRG